MLGGRTPVKYIVLEGIGPAVIKKYGRGGLIRHINSQWYLKMGKTRCQKEFENIINAKSLGVSVPDPIAFVYTDGIFYQAWLITVEIKEHHTLAEVSITDQQRAKDIMGIVIKQLRLMIDTGIHHVDLHPGNILVSPGDKVFIVDFDKAYKYKGKKNSLKRKYISRWQRAIRKHGLPEVLIKRLKDEL